MHVKLILLTGPAAGRSFELVPGKVGLVGRASWAELPIPDDVGVSGRHFALECHDRHCRLRDLKSTNGTFVNGESVPEAFLQNGDRIRAGQSEFEVVIDEAGGGLAAVDVAPPPSVSDTQRKAALAAARPAASPPVSPPPVPPPPPPVAPRPTAVVPAVAAPPPTARDCVVIEVIAGPGVGRRHVLLPGKSALVGRASWAEVPVADDTVLSGRHFTLAFENGECRLRDLQSKNGTRLNGQPVTEGVVNHGDHVMAGQSVFRVMLEGSSAIPAATVPEVRMAARPLAAPGVPAEQRAAAPPPRGVPAPAPPAKPSVFDPLMRMLREPSEPLYALLDAARDPAILPLLQDSNVLYRSLYEGVQGESLARWAPYLVELPKRSAFLETLLAVGWGRSWGVFLNASDDFVDVRKHFRHFLLCKLPDGRDAYFRFYDPRVLRVFLPAGTEEQMPAFFGPVSRFVMEDRLQDTVVQFALAAKKVREKLVPLFVER